MDHWKKRLQLFCVFFKIGLFTFGGGYAMIAMIMHEASERRNWISQEEMTDVIAIAESTPGPIAINSATYIGYKQAGVSGSAFATLGVVLPSLIIIYLISLCVEWFLGFTAVQSAFKGIQVAVTLLILRAGWKLAVKVPRKPVPLICCIAAFFIVGMMNFTSLSLSTIWLIVAGAAVGVIRQLLKLREEGGAKGNA